MRCAKKSQLGDFLPIDWPPAEEAELNEDLPETSDSNSEPQNFKSMKREM